MLGAARQAADGADVEFRRLRKLLDVERGSLEFIRRPIGVPELLRPSIAIASAHAPKGVRVISDVPDALPRALTDPLQTQEAMTSVINSIAERSPHGSTVSVIARETEPGTVQFRVSGDGALQPENDNAALRLAAAVLKAQGAGVTQQGDGIAVTLAAERV